MAGIVTSNRTFPYPDSSYTATKGTTPLTGVHPGNVCTQTTTSWRTRGGLDAETSLPDTPDTEAGVFQFLLDDAKLHDSDPRNSYDTGHTFSSKRQHVVKNVHVSLRGTRSTGQSCSYNGNVVPFSFGVTGFPLFPDPPSFASRVNAFGAIAISKTAPNNPASTFGTGAGELLLDGTASIPGHTLQERCNFFRKLGKEYLNVSFGWLPFVADLKSTAEAILNHHKLISQLTRNSGRPIRRAFYFRPERSSQVLGSAAGSLLGPTIWSGSDWDSSTNGKGLVNTSGSTYQLFSETTVQPWFKGCFLYYIPEGGSFLDDMERNVALARYLTRTELNPELLWQLAPWSWLVDWFLHLGRFMSLVSRFGSDGLVLKYGYLMATTTVTYHHQIQNWRPGTGSGYGDLRSDVLMTQTVLKERFRSTPYGFGVSSSSFTDFQWSILGALGLSKAPHSLH